MWVQVFLWSHERGDVPGAYVADWKDFEGTHDFSSLVTDLEFYKSGTAWSTCGDCKVHSGFPQEFKSLQTCIEQAETAHFLRHQREAREGDGTLVGSGPLWM